MEKIKAKFHFVAGAGANSKSTVVKVKTIQLVDQEEIFAFLKEQQTSEAHKQLFATNVVRNVVKSLNVRDKYRNVVISLTDELQTIYLDEEGNVDFHDLYLDEVQSKQEVSVPSANTERSMHSIAKDMVLEKFNGNNSNAKTWMTLFIQESKRLGLKENKYAEALRLFLEGSALTWYTIYVQTNTLAHAWEFWNNSFLDTFDEKSWDQVEYAYSFKYLNGSFLDFALKKRSLLIEVDPDLTLKSQINLIVVSLPQFIKNKLKKKELVTIEDLMSRLRLFGQSNKIVKPKQNMSEKKNCTHCEKLGYKNRFDPENLCRNRTVKNENIKLVNNSEIQDAVAHAEKAKNV